MDDPVELFEVDRFQALRAAIQRLAHVPEVPIGFEVLTLIGRIAVEEGDVLCDLVVEDMSQLVGGLMKVTETQSARDACVALLALKTLIGTSAVSFEFIYETGAHRRK